MFSIIPQPQTIKVENKHKFTFTKLTKITYQNFDQTLAQAMDQSLQTISPEINIIFQIDTPTSIDLSQPCTKLIVKNQPQFAPEEYRIVITEHQKITIACHDLRGFVNAMATLCQIYLQDEMFSQMTIHDWPQHQWRSHMVVIQHQKWTIDDYQKHFWHLFLFKINRCMLNGGTTGWALSTLPSINELGGVKHSQQHGITKTSLTMASAKYLAVYGKKLGIDVYPGFNTPGHSARFVKHHQTKLSCDVSAKDLTNIPAVDQHNYPVCIAKKSTRTLLKKIYDELATAFHSQYVHIGGDECATIWWNYCNRCQAKMASNGWDDVYQLQSDYMLDLINYLAKRGKTAIVWDDVLEYSRFAAPNLIVEFWRDWYFIKRLRGPSHHITSDLKKRGQSLIKYLSDNKIPMIASWNSMAYFDWSNSASTTVQGEQSNSILTLKNAYQYQLNIFAKKQPHPQILGGASLMWDQLDRPQFEQKIYPRLLANAEILWGTNKSFDNFLPRACTNAQRLLTKLGINYFPGDLT